MKCLRSFVKASQDFYRSSDRLRIKNPSGENSATQSRDFAIFVDDVETMSVQGRDFETNRVGADINRGKSWHR
jgi:hypothetical protein